MPTPRLLLFGSPGAGKSSLLGALLQAAPAHQVEIAGPSEALQDLQKKTYSNKSAPTLDTETYQLRFRPIEKGAPGPAFDLTVIDSSGKDAQAMLQADEPFQNGSPLQKPILDAEVVALVVDVSLPQEKRQAEFDRFARWLLQLSAARGQRVDIADLPVFLVLNKCDLLARKEDTASLWQKRIDEGTRRIGEKFRESLKDQGIGFGTVKVHPWATAIRRPALADSDARPKEPFGVAEFFRQCVESAREFQDRRGQAQGRLQNVLFGLLGLIAILTLVVAFLYEFQPESRSTALDEKVQVLLPADDASSVQRLQGTPKRLEEKFKSLREIEAHADFAKLPSSTQEAVSGYRAEIGDYLQRYNEALVVLKLPHFAKNQKDLDEQEKAVRSFTLTEAQARSWGDTRLGKRLAQTRGEYDALHQALDQEEAWIRREITEANRILKEGTGIYGKLLSKDPDAPETARKWLGQLDEQMYPRPHMPREDTIKGVTRMIWEDLAKFDKVQKAQKEWSAAKGELLGLSKLVEKKLRAGS